MKVDVCLIPLEVTEERIKDRVIAVVDVLRASTSIIYALEHNARAVIPTESVADAMDKAQQFERETLLLCGERDGKKIVGFDLGNSPIEYSPDVVKGKTIIFSSTNGSKTLLKTRSAKASIIASFVNLSASVQFLLNQNSDIVIICAGKLDRFSLEDAVCAGFIANMISEQQSDAIFTDGALAASALAMVYGTDLNNMLAGCRHGEYLTSIGMESDLSICAEVDRFTSIPLFRDGKIIRTIVSDLEN